MALDQNQLLAQSAAQRAAARPLNFPYKLSVVVESGKGFKHKGSHKIELRLDGYE